MSDPRQIAQRLLGAIDWQNEVSGFCRCPGEAMHTHRNGKKDCRVNVDGAPTVFCFHSSCIAAVSEANQRLRRELGGSPWQIILPGGRVLRSGDVLQKSGEVLPREVIAGVRGQGTGVRWQDSEKLILETVRVLAERYRGELTASRQFRIIETQKQIPISSNSFPGSRFDVQPPGFLAPLRLRGFGPPNLADEWFRAEDQAESRHSRFIPLKFKSLLTHSNLANHLRLADIVAHTTTRCPCT